MDTITSSDAMADAIEAFVDTDPDVLLFRSDEPLHGFCGRRPRVSLVCDGEDGDLAVEFVSIEAAHTVGWITVPALAAAEWRDVERDDAAGEPLPSTHQCLAIDIGGDLEVHVLQL